MASAEAIQRNAASCTNVLQVVYRLHECSGTWGHASALVLQYKQQISLLPSHCTQLKDKLHTVNSRRGNYGCLTHIAAVLNLEDNQ